MKLKMVERAWKAGALRVVCLLMRMSGRPGPAPDWRARPTRILFLRQDRIGDAIVSSGLLRAIKSVSRDLTIDALASPRNAEILRRDSSVSVVHVFDKRRPGSFIPLRRRLRAARYDAVIDCMVTAPSMTGLMLMAASGARHRIGIAGRGVDPALTIPVEPTRDSEHIIDLLAAFARPFGIDRDATDWRPALQLTESEAEDAERRWGPGTRGGRRRLLVNVSAGHPDRYWPEDRFVEAIRRLRDRFDGLEVIVVGDPREAERSEAIARAAGVRTVETPAIADAVGMVATADFLLSPDTSIAHMAEAFAVPRAVMYKDEESVAQWGPYRTAGVNIASDGSVSRLPVDRVVPEVERLIGAE